MLIYETHFLVVIFKHIDRIIQNRVLNFISMAMVLGMTSMAAFAADGDPTGSITVKPSDTVGLASKNLNAYRILDATYSPATTALEDGQTQAISYTIPAAMLSFYENEFKTDTKTLAALAADANKTVDRYVVDSIAALTASQLKDFEYRALAAAKAANLQAYAGATSGDNKVFSNLPAGYYVIEDVGTGKPLSALMLDTVTDANVEINLKAEDQTEKKVKTSAELVQEKANELGLGRNVDYVITGEIPDYTGFEYMYYMVNDTLSAGLTFNPDSVVVKIKRPASTAAYAPKSAYAYEAEANLAGYQRNTSGDDNNYWMKPATTESTTQLVKGTDYYLYSDKTADAAVLGTKTFVIAFADIVASDKIAIGDTVEVTYNATVNSDAITGINPNTNKVTIEYSNNPDKDHREDTQSKPGIPANKENHPTGEGPEKDTNTYTTKIKILKEDGDTDNPLTGVEFTLTGTAKDVVYRTEEVFEIDPAGTYWLLKNGKYTQTAPTNATVEETTGGAGWVEDASYTGTDARVVGSKKYRPYVPSTDSALTRYTIVESNAGDYASTTTKYAKKTVTTTSTAEAVTDSYAVTRTGITAGDDASVTFAQLGAGTYKLSETGVLAGYNGLTDIEFKVNCTLPDDDDVIAGTETATWTVTSLTDDVDVRFVEGTGDDAGTFVITLENNKGQELPSTGGIGTTIFYVVGAILVIGAGVVLITKRRMEA